VKRRTQDTTAPIVAVLYGVRFREFLSRALEAGRGLGSRSGLKTLNGVVGGLLLVEGEECLANRTCACRPNL
jgi:hypothetical protein